MKNYLFILLLFTSLFSFTSCDNDTIENATAFQCPMKCEADKIYPEQGSCPICKMDLKPVHEAILEDADPNEISETSIFNLTTKWNTEEGKTIELKELNGKTLVLVMIYTTCKAACPRLVADMRNIEGAIPPELLPNIDFVLVSIDPETDTPEVLKAFAIENLMDEEHWTFLQGTVNGVREFANVLAVKYKQISPMDFSHSNIISVFNPKGELVHQKEGLGVDNKETVLKIIETAQY